MPIKRMETLPFKNREIKIVYQPNPGMPGSDKPKGRFGVGVGALRKYVGDHNAQTALQRAADSGDDKYTVKLRKYGRIDFYFK